MQPIDIVCPFRLLLIIIFCVFSVFSPLVNDSLQRKGLLISGGGGVREKVELYDIESKSSCLMPNLPAHRSNHIMNKNLICGGAYDANRTCVQLKDGEWKTSHTLLHPRQCLNK